MIEHANILKSCGKYDMCLDRIVEKLEDGAVKVCVHSISCLEKIHHQNRKALSGIQNIFLSGILAASSSSNRQVNAPANSLLDDFLSDLSGNAIIPPICNTAMHSKDRLKIICFKVLVRHLSRFVIDSFLETKRFIFVFYKLSK